MNRYTYFLLIITLLFAVVSCNKSSLTKENVEGMLEQNINIGDNANAVIKYLDDNNIEHSQLLKGNDYATIHAIIRDVHKSIFVRESILITFTFDSKSLLIKYDVKSAYTGV